MGVFTTLCNLPLDIRTVAFPLLKDLALQMRAQFWTGATAESSGPTKRILMAYYRFVPTTGRRITTSEMIDQIPSLQDALKNRHGFTRMRFEDIPVAAKLLGIPLKWVLDLPDNTPCLNRDLELDNLFCLYEQLGPKSKRLFRIVLDMYETGLLNSEPIHLSFDSGTNDYRPGPNDPKTIAADVARKILTQKKSFEKYYNARREFFQTETTKQLTPLSYAERRHVFPNKIVRMKDCVTGLRLLPIEAWRPFVTRFYGEDVSLHEFLMGYRTLDDPVYRFDISYAALCQALPEQACLIIQKRFKEEYAAAAGNHNIGIIHLLDDYAEEIGVHPFNIYSIRVCNMRIKDGELSIQGDKKAIASRANLSYIYNSSNKPTLKQLMLLSLYTGISMDRLVAAATDQNP